MSVITAFKLDDFVPAGCTSRESYRAHSGLGTRARHSDLLETGYQAAKPFCQLDLDFGRAAKAEAVLRSLYHRVTYFWVVVPHDHGAPRQHIVDVFIAVRVKDIGAVGALHKARGSADCFKRSNGRVNATWNVSLCALKQRF